MTSYRVPDRHNRPGGHRLSPSCAAKRARSTAGAKRIIHKSGTAVTQDRLEGFPERKDDK